MKKLAILLAVMVATAHLLAMPTRAELSKAQPLVVELMAPTLEEYKSATDKTAGAVKVGDNSCAFAAEAETEAVKFLLLKGAVGYYVRGEAYDKAADCIAKMKTDIKDLTPDAIADIVGKASGKITASKAPRLLAYYRAAKLQISARNEIPGLEKKLKRDKNDQLQRRYAEALAISGNWKAAYAAFAKSRNAPLAQLAEAEAKGAAANAQAAEIWWSYTPEFEGAENFFKIHAAEFYKKALEKGEISGLKKNIVERRIAQVSEEAAVPVVSNASDVSRGGDSAAGQSKTKMIDLGGGVKMEMIYVAPGSFMMGSDNGEKTRPVHKVMLTKGFWLGKYEVTQRQWKQVMSNEPSKFKGNDRPVEMVTWDDCQAFIRKVNGKLGGERVRLPTEAEWEYACRAGSGGDFGGTGRLEDMGWFRENSGDETHPVGQKHANAWGFHDMHGNVWEWCSDWWGDYSSEAATDPVGQAGGERRVARGGAWDCKKVFTCSAASRVSFPSRPNSFIGFRLCMTADDGTSAPVVANASEASRRGDSAAVQAKTKMIDLGGGVKMEMIYVAPGLFMMGSDNGGKSRPAHKVTLTEGFWLGKYEVTQKQWKHIMANNPSRSFKGDNLPVNMVSFETCQEFIRKLNRKLGDKRVRLPTEAEWEYACRAGTGGDFGGSGSLDDMGWYTDNSDGKIHPVGQKQANAWGFHDMHGNVWEWCNDRWGGYPQYNVSDPIGASSGSERVIRGGSWGSPMKWCYSAYRWKENPSHADEHSGFRLCMTDDDGVSSRSN